MVRQKCSGIRRSYLGLTDSDLKGSIQQLRTKATNKVEGLPLPDDDKTLIDWLRKGGIER